MKGLVGCTLVLLAYFLGRRVKVSFINEEVGYGVLSTQTLRPTMDDRYTKTLLTIHRILFLFSLFAVANLGAFLSVTNWS